ncbi:bacterio-opsin activator domain-containing protein [Haladaptatus sp. DJG-WS-42]|uniref:bacterio-opsin activator domain-containing protein n=1 Tax=Haladaptatus sp. DJG-WS-42 TaxID=3120516 RepID=UPI0030CABD9E
MAHGTNAAQSEAITSTILETSPVGIAVFDGDATIVRVNDRLADLLGAAKDEIIEKVTRLEEWPVYDETRTHVPKADLPIRQVLVSGEPLYNHEYQIPRSDGDWLWCSLNAAPIFDDDGAVAFVVVSVEDITERKAREQALIEQHAELQTVNQINNVIRDINHSLVGATTQEEIETAVCEAIAGSALYEFAWIGERHTSGVGMVPRASAGVDAAYYDTLRSLARNNPEAAERWPSTKVFTTGTYSLARDVSKTTAIPGEIQTHSQRLSGESSVAIPLLYDTTVYAVLVISTDREDAFTTPELNVLCELGETIGYAINAIQTRRLLFTDSVIELEFEVADENAVFAQLSREASCHIEIHQLVTRTDGGLVLYCEVSGAPAETVEETARAFPEIKTLRRIREDNGATLFEFSVSVPSAAKSLMDLGGQITRTAATDGVSRIVVEFAPEADIYAAVHAVSDIYPNATLIAKRERDRPVETTREFRHKLNEQLTDRQRDALSAAYHAGYFDWPRGSTAEEIASSMGISSATFHQHLRAAQRKRLSAFFGGNERGNLHT